MRASIRLESDPLFVFDGERYVPLDADRWAAIQNGTMRF